MSTSQAFARHDNPQPDKWKDVPVAENEQSKDGMAVSEEEYWKTYYDDLDFIYEWNNGFLEVRPMSDIKGSLAYQWFCDILRAWFRTNPVGRMINLDIGFRLGLSHKVSVRILDLSVVLDSNPVKIDEDDCRYPGTFDLCIESLSHSNLRHVKRDTVDKKNEYEGVGVREYYILDAQKIETAFYTLNKFGKYYKIKPVEGNIIKSSILPGFQFRISDLYRQPLLDGLVEDEIYNKYVFPSHKQKIDRVENLLILEKKRADKEKQRAEQEKQQTKQEKQRADKAEQRIDKAEQRIDKVENLLSLEKQKSEKMAAKLKELGISIM